MRQVGRLPVGDVTLACFLSRISPLELYVEQYAYAPFVDVGHVAVGESVYIVNAQYLEDIRYSHSKLHVWHCAKIVLLVILVWEGEQLSAVEWVGAVLFAQVSEHAAERQNLSPSEFLYERYAVQYESVHVVCEVPRCILVVEEFHCIHE